MRSGDLIFFVCAVVGAILIESSNAQRRSRLATGAGQAVEFDCPEEFGYYPHPTDCTQYYVCVFGGALLESCTGGLMYSHELQTCDWPRNVGCGGAGESATVSTVRVTDPRTRQTTPTAQNTRSAAQVAREQVQMRQQQEEIAKHQLYADDIGPAEEIENDRQQRVYRGQPSTVGQVARDRDGLRHQPVTNSIPSTRTSSAEKVAVISFGNQPTQNTQYSLDILTEDNFLTNETPHRRKKRQARFRYPAQIVQVVPSGGRVPSPSVHSVGNGGIFKYQGNLNRNKPPRLTDPLNSQEASFQSALNPNVSPDIHQFRSPDKFGNSKTRTPPNTKFSNHDTNYGHRPPINLEPDLKTHSHTTSNSNKRQPNNNNNNKHSGGGSSPAHSIIIPSSYATFQNLPDVPLHFASQTSAANQSLIRKIPHAKSPGYASEADNFAFFHLDQANSQAPHYISTPPPLSFFSASPTLSNLLTTLKNAEILVGQNQNPQAAANDQSGLQFLKSLTSLHEVPYNSDGTRLYHVPQPNQHELGVGSDFNSAHLIHHVAGQSNTNFPGLTNYQSQYNSHPLNPHANEGKPSTSGTTTQAPFTPNSNPYGIKYNKEEKKLPGSQDSSQKDVSQQFSKPPSFQYQESQQKKQVSPSVSFASKPDTSESGKGSSSEYSSEEYYDDSGEDVVDSRYRRPQSHYYNSNNKFKNNQNPFADVNFDFDKFIDKLRGGYQTTVTHSPSPGKPKGTVTESYGKPEEYEDYSDEEYEEYEESEEKSQGGSTSSQQFTRSEHSKHQTSTESDPSIINASTTTKYKIPVNHGKGISNSNIKTVHSQVPDTLTVPFFHGPDGNIYSRLPAPPEESTPHPFSLHVSTHHPTNHQVFHKPSFTQGGQSIKPSQSPVPQTSTVFSGLRERVPSHKGYGENILLKTTTTSNPLPISLRPSSHNQVANTEDYAYSTKAVTVHETNLNRTRPVFGQTHIHLLPNRNQGILKETTTHSYFDYSSPESDYNEYISSSTTKYPVKITKEPNRNNHNRDMIHSTQASVILDVSSHTKAPSKALNRHRESQSSHLSGGSKLNTSLYTEGANIFSSVKDTISMMSNGSKSTRSGVNATNAATSHNQRFTSSTPTPGDINTTLKTYTIRRRPSKVPSTTPRYRNRKPSSSNNQSNSDNVHSSTLPRPETMNLRPNRRPVVKNRSRTTTEKPISTTDFDMNESTDKAKSANSRHNKKIVPDKDGSRIVNKLRVEPSPAPVSYVQQPSLQASPSPASYNNSQQYDNSQYDPYYSLYDDEVELYRDVDYTQFTSNQGQTQTGNQQYRGQSPYKQAPQQPEIQSQRNVAYAQPTYNTQDVYSQSSGTQDYNGNYNTQLSNDQLQYQEQAARQPTKAPSRGTPSGRIRGNSGYTASTASDTVNRGTPASVRTRPTLKPSTAIVPKAQEFVDIYRYPPKRPDALYPTPQVDKTAAKCRKDVCLLPDCYCGGKDIPGGFEPEEIPQIVLLTFDDSANDLNKGLYSDLFETGRKNPNGCPISATFYVSHEWTDYSHVQNLYAGGHEIASHSISHSFGEQFSQKKWTKEIGGQREILSAYGGVKLEDIRGMRAPFLAVGGNKMFKMLYDSNFTYDSSMPVYENRPPSWPYTLDYKIFHDCMIPPCPTRSYPGVWEVPMVMWQDLNGGRCSMGDACSNPPTADGVYKMLIKNFERHYTTNRAPFGLFYHAAWFTQPHHKEGFEAFLDTIVNMPDVWLITNWQAIQWMRDPTPLSRINNFQPWQCNYPDRPKKCSNPKVCNLWHKSGVRYMRTCQPCPDIYPWTGKTGVRNSRVDNEVIDE